MQTWNKFHALFWCLYCLLWKSKWKLPTVKCQKNYYYHILFLLIETSVCWRKNLLHPFFFRLDLYRLKLIRKLGYYPTWVNKTWLIAQRVMVILDVMVVFTRTLLNTLTIMVVLITKQAIPITLRLVRQVYHVLYCDIVFLFSLHITFYISSKNPASQFFDLSLSILMIAV